MKVYIDEKDIGLTVTYKEEFGKKQYLYVHDKDGFVFKSLEEHDKETKKTVFNSIIEKLYDTPVDYDYKIDIEEVIDIIKALAEGVQNGNPN